MCIYLVDVENAMVVVCFTSFYFWDSFPRGKRYEHGQWKTVKHEVGNTHNGQGNDKHTDRSWVPGPDAGGRGNRAQDLTENICPSPGSPENVSKTIQKRFKNGGGAQGGFGGVGCGGRVTGVGARPWRQK